MSLCALGGEITRLYNSTTNGLQVGAALLFWPSGLNRPEPAKRCHAPAIAPKECGTEGSTMPEDMIARAEGAAGDAPAAPPSHFLLNRFARAFANSPVPFGMTLPDGTIRQFGQVAPEFHVTLRNRNGFRAITSLDEFGDVAGEIDIDGDMLRPLALRQALVFTRALAGGLI
jgi:hypothetical protein